jgi:hypothetical protein
MGTWGVTIFGPMWAWWYRFLDARLHVYSAQSIAAKVAITATVMAPISNALFFTFMTAGERILHKVCISDAVLTNIDDAYETAPVAAAGHHRGHPTRRGRVPTDKAHPGMPVI